MRIMVSFVFRVYSTKHQTDQWSYQMFRFSITFIYMQSYNAQQFYKDVNNLGHLQPSVLVYISFNSLISCVLYHLRILKTCVVYS